MNYRINKLDDPKSIVERQADLIVKLRTKNAEKTNALIEASKEIVKLKAEKADLTAALNKASRPVNMRADQNWDGGFRAEVSE